MRRPTRVDRHRLPDWRVWLRRVRPHARFDVTERLTALLLLVVVALVAGLTLGHSTKDLKALPGLLLMVPAAIALRGNIFGALGSRLGTAIHTGTFRLSLRPSSVVGENVLAATILTVATSVVLAVLAKGASVAFGIAESISIGDFVVVSLVGGLLASVVVLVTALALTAGSVRFGWDPDNVTAPLVTAVGDVATVPALVVASGLTGDDRVGIPIAVLGLLSLPLSFAWVMARGRAGLQVIVRESLPVLIVAIVLDLIAGATVERQIDQFASAPALLVLLPAFLAAGGAIGGSLSSRLSSQLHLGIIDSRPVPEVAARSEIAIAVGLAVPIFLSCAVLAHVLSVGSGLGSPGSAWLIAASLIAGLLAALLAAAVAYYSTIGSVRVGLDPDTVGIPLVTSAMDLLGAITLILAVEALGFV